jgi:hypothetical protein
MTCEVDARFFELFAHERAVFARERVAALIERRNFPAPHSDRVMLEARRICLLRAGAADQTQERKNDEELLTSQHT